MNGLPNDIKNQFYLSADTLYPDYNAILSKVDSVIEKLNKIGLNTKNSTMKHNNPNNSNSNAGKSQVINYVTNDPSSSSKSGRKSKKRWPKVKCRFVNPQNIPVPNVLNILLRNPE